MSKRQTLTLHRWLGIVILVPLLLQTLTGLMLVYKWPLARWLDSSGMQRATQHVDSTAGQIVDRASGIWSDSQIRRLYFPDSARGTFFLLLQQGNGERYYASMDPGDARVLREGSIWTFPVEAALQLHFQPLPGRKGTTLVLLTGVGLLFLMAVGTVAWWPRKGRWRQSLGIKRGLRHRLMFRQLHRTLGILMLPVFTVLAITGCLMAIEIALQKAGPTTTGMQQAPAAVTGADVDTAIALAQSVVPGAQLRDMSFPEGNTKVQFHAPEKNQRAVHSVLLGGNPLRVLKYVPAEENTAWWVTLLPIHSGDILRPWGHWIVLGAGFCLLVIGSLGAWLWLPERKT